MASFPQNMHDSIKRGNSVFRPPSRKGMNNKQVNKDSKQQEEEKMTQLMLTRETEIRPTGAREGVIFKGV